MKVRLLVAVAVMFFGISYALNSMRPDVGAFNRENAARRQIDRICAAIKRGEIRERELCTTPIPEISQLKNSYENIRTVDGEWYAAHGWSYFPKTDCDSNGLHFSLMDMNFECSSGRSRKVNKAEVKPSPKVDIPKEQVKKPIAAGAIELCFQEGSDAKLRSVQKVLEDGTIVLDGNERVKLAGVKFPPDITSPVTKNSCLGDTVRYLSATLGSRSITVYRVPNTVRDDKFRLPVYVINQTNQLINQQLIRYGLARADGRAIKLQKLSCGEDFSKVERIARERNEGGWLNRCFTE